MTIKGTRHDDDLTGTTGNDVFNMAQGGDDTVHGGRGDDTFMYGDKLTAADHIDGGMGTDTLVLGGDYTGANAFTFDGVNITKIEALQLRAGFSYDFTVTNISGDSGTFTIDGHMLGAGDSLSVDASTLQFVPLVMIGGAGDDVLIGGANRPTTFDLSKGGDDAATGGDANDLFRMGAGLSAGDRIDGGTGNNNTLELRGHYGDPDFLSPFTFDDSTIANVQSITLLGNFDYGLKFADGNVAAGETLTIDASALNLHRAIHIDASAETDGSYTMIAAAGDNTLIGGALNDTFVFHGPLNSGDFVDGGGGNDIVTFGEIGGLVVDAGSMNSIERLGFSGTSDVALTGTWGPINLVGTGTASFKADISGATVNLLSFQGGDGDDTLVFGADVATNDFVDGGKGIDTVSFEAASLTVAVDGHFEYIEKVVLLGATSTYTVTLDTNFDPTQGPFVVDASALTDSSSSLHLDATHQGNNFLTLIGGAGDDVIVGGANFDTIDGGAGDDTITGGNSGDTLTGGAGHDTFYYASADDSDARATSYDRITDFDAASDLLRIPFAVTYDGEASGSVTRPAQDLAAIVNPLMTVDGAVLVHVTGGKLDGHTLLAIDANHDGQFTTDMVIDLTGMTNAASFGAGDFIT